MKSERSGYIEIRIDMVRIVKSPQEARDVVGAMPVVERYVQQQEPDDPSCALGQGDDRQQADFRRVLDQCRRHRLYEGRGSGHRESAHADIDEKATDEPPFWSAQGEYLFQRK